MAISDNENRDGEANESDGENQAPDDEENFIDEEAGDENNDAMEQEQVVAAQDKQPCDLALETLVVQLQLSGDQPCPSCTAPVNRHLPDAAIKAKYSATQSSDKDEKKDSESSGSIDKAVLKIVASLNSKDRPQLQFRPPDSKHPSVQPYLDALQNALEPFSGTLSSKHWYRVFALLTTKCSETDQTQIFQKITKPKLDWESLCDTLRQLFDKTEYIRVLDESFTSGLKHGQKENESVRAYNTRFDVTRQRLGYSENDRALPSIYINGLRPDIRKAYNAQRKQMRTNRILLDGSAAASQSVSANGHPPLKKIQEVCLELDQKSGDGEDGDSAVVQPHSKFPSGTKLRDPRGKHKHERCKEHPNANHTDAQCNRHRFGAAADRLRQNLQQKKRKRDEAHGSGKGDSFPKRPPRQDTASPITCFTCGKIGHKSPECRSNLPPGQWRKEQQVKEKGGSTSSSSSASSKPWEKPQQSASAPGGRSINARRARAASDKDERIENDSEAEGEEPPVKRPRSGENRQAKRQLKSRKVMRIAKAVVRALSDSDSDESDGDDESH